MRNRPYGFEIYLVNVKTIRTIAQIFVAFSEKLNFTATASRPASLRPPQPRGGRDRDNDESGQLDLVAAKTDAGRTAVIAAEDETGTW